MAKKPGKETGEDILKAIMEKGGKGAGKAQEAAAAALKDAAQELKVAAQIQKHMAKENNDIIHEFKQVAVESKKTIIESKKTAAENIKLAKQSAAEAKRAAAENIRATKQAAAAAKEEQKKATRLDNINRKLLRETLVSSKTSTEEQKKSKRLDNINKKISRSNDNIATGTVKNIGGLIGGSIKQSIIGDMLNPKALMGAALQSAGLEQIVPTVVGGSGKGSKTSRQQQKNETDQLSIFESIEDTLKSILKYTKENNLVLMDLAESIQSGARDRIEAAREAMKSNEEKNIGVGNNSEQSGGFLNSLIGFASPGKLLSLLPLLLKNAAKIGIVAAISEIIYTRLSDDLKNTLAEYGLNEETVPVAAGAATLAFSFIPKKYLIKGALIGSLAGWIFGQLDEYMGGELEKALGIGPEEVGALVGAGSIVTELAANLVKAARGAATKTIAAEVAETAAKTAVTTAGSTAAVTGVVGGIFTGGAALSYAATEASKGELGQAIAGESNRAAEEGRSDLGGALAGDYAVGAQIMQGPYAGLTEAQIERKKARERKEAAERKLLEREKGGFFGGYLAGDLGIGKGLLKDYSYDSTLDTMIRIGEDTSIPLAVNKDVIGSKKYKSRVASKSDIYSADLGTVIPNYIGSENIDVNSLIKNSTPDFKMEELKEKIKKLKQMGNENVQVTPDNKQTIFQSQSGWNAMAAAGQPQVVVVPSSGGTMNASRELPSNPRNSGAVSTAPAPSLLDRTMNSRAFYGAGHP